MGDTIEVSRDILEPITELVKLGLYSDEKEALKNLVLERAAAKIRHFDSKIEEMGLKYKMNFEAFKHRIEARRGEEVFEEWDDFIIWESYESGRAYWNDVQRRLKGRSE
ncbi:MAG: hypothetical protein QUS07_05755 [Methanothrix sp.]|nr:hypothetical protein [Methanothrix sp.]